MSYPNDFFSTIVAASNQAASNLTYSNTMLDTVFTGYEPAVGEVGQTLTINVPTIGDVVSDIGAGDISDTNVTNDTVTLAISKKQSTSFVVRSFDELRSERDLADVYLKPRLEALVREVNADLATFISSTSFGDYSAVAGGADTFVRADLAEAWANLAGAGVPIGDGNLFMIVHPTVYANMLSDTSFHQESVVGVNAAEAAQQRALIAPQFGCRINWDQHCPVVSGVYSALLYHRYAIALRYMAEQVIAGPDYVQTTFVYPKPNMPVKVETWYDPTKQGQRFHLSVCYGRAVVRSEMASYMATA